jgi:hypothetical protein
MSNKKIWITTELYTEFGQNIRIQPTETFDGVLLEIKETDASTYDARLYLNAETLEAMIAKLREMMEYVKE